METCWLESQPLNPRFLRDNLLAEQHPQKDVHSLVHSFKNLIFWGFFIFSLQAKRNSEKQHDSSTAADLLQAKQQILTHQQQLEEQDHLLEDYHRKKEDSKCKLVSAREN